MPIHIKNSEAERLLAEIKAATGKDTEAVILDLLRCERARLKAERGARARKIREATRELQKAWAEAEVIDPRSPEEILDYDERGLPR